MFYKNILHSVIANADQHFFLTYKKFGVLKTATATKSTMNDSLTEEFASFNRDLTLCHKIYQNTKIYLRNYPKRSTQNISITT